MGLVLTIVLIVCGICNLSALFVVSRNLWRSHAGKYAWLRITAALAVICLVTGVSAAFDGEAGAILRALGVAACGSFPLYSMLLASAWFFTTGTSKLGRIWLQVAISLALAGLPAATLLGQSTQMSRLLILIPIVWLISVVCAAIYCQNLPGNVTVIGCGEERVGSVAQRPLVEFPDIQVATYLWWFAAMSWALVLWCVTLFSGELVRYY